jgi:hypothetical protein
LCAAPPKEWVAELGSVQYQAKAAPSGSNFPKLARASREIKFLFVSLRFVPDLAICEMEPKGAVFPMVNNHFSISNFQY